MSVFAERVEHVCSELMVQLFTQDREREYVREPRRIEEAEAVAPCVERLVDYEIDPPAHGKGVGRYAPVSIIPPLGELIGERKKQGLDENTLRALQETINTAVACGYVGLTGVEPTAEKIDPRVDVDPREIWNLWVVQLNSGALQSVGLPGEIRDAICHFATDVFAAELSDLELLPKVRKRMRYGAVGQWYGEAGMVLRLIQAGSPIADESTDFWQIVNTWPFERESV